MIRQLILAAVIICSSVASFGQFINPTINKDSLAAVIAYELPESLRYYFMQEYTTSTGMKKEGLLVWEYMNRAKGSKSDMIHNVDSNYQKFLFLKKAYSKIVPKDLVVYVEFYPADDVIMQPAYVDMLIIDSTDQNYASRYDQAWTLHYDSDTLQRMLKRLRWTNDTLQMINKWLLAANCISIENKKPCSIGFVRSGLGKYYYEISDNDLTKDEVDKMKKDCGYHFYRNNIAFKWGSGAVGGPCFPPR